jgi:hypothetical protein
VGGDEAADAIPHLLTSLTVGRRKDEGGGGSCSPKDVHGYIPQVGDGDGVEGARGVGVTLETRLNARVLDLRSVNSQHMVRMRASVAAIFRSCLVHK